MFSLSLKSTIRSGTAYTTRSYRTGSTPASACAKVAQPTRQQRLASSKASCPPDRSGGAPQQQQPTDATSKPGPEGEKRPAGRRKTKDAAAELAAMKARDDPFFRLPAVPSTQHLHPAGKLLVCFSVSARD